MALNKFGVGSILQTLVFCSIHQFGHVWAPDNLLNSDTISDIEKRRKRQAHTLTRSHVCMHGKANRFISEYLALQFYHTVGATIELVVRHIPTKSLSLSLSHHRTCTRTHFREHRQTHFKVTLWRHLPISSNILSSWSDSSLKMA